MRRLIRLLAFLTKAKFTAGSVIGVLGADDRVLLVKNRYRERARYSLPGGFRKYRENAYQTILRELEEEVGISLTRDEVLQIDHYQQRWAAHFDYLFVTRVASSVVPKASRIREIRTAEWHSFDNLPELNRAAELALPRIRRWIELNPRGSAQVS